MACGQILSGRLSKRSDSGCALDVRATGQNNSGVLVTLLMSFQYLPECLFFSSVVVEPEVLCQGSLLLISPDGILVHAMLSTCAICN